MTSYRGQEYNYTVHIREIETDAPIEIVGYLQDTLRFSTSAKWEQLMSGFGSTIQKLLQAVSAGLTIGQGAASFLPTAHKDSVTRLTGAGQKVIAAAKEMPMLQLKEATSHYWTGTTPVQLDIPITFIAEESGYADVTENIKKVNQLCLPGDINNLDELKEKWSALREAASNLLTTSSNLLMSTEQAKAAAAKEAAVKEKEEKEEQAVAARAGTQGSNEAPFADYDVSQLMIQPHKVQVRLGHFMQIKKAVITNVSNDAVLMFDSGGNPTKASVVISLLTDTVLTKGDFEKALIATK